jgi:hypothetical protein
MISNGSFRVIEYEQCNEGLRVAYESSKDKTFCLRDASRMAGALSYAHGCFVQVLPVTAGETYTEWWYAGQLDREPTITVLSGFWAGQGLQHKA